MPVAACKADVSSGIVMSPALPDDLGEEGAMRIEPLLAFGRPGGAAQARLVRRIESAHLAPVAGDSLIATMPRARSTFLLPTSETAAVARLAKVLT